MHQPPLPHRIYSWYSFLLKAVSNLGPSAAGRNKSRKNSNNTIGNRNRDLLVCSCRFPQLNQCHFQNDSQWSSVFCCVPPSLDTYPFHFSSSVWFPPLIFSLGPVIRHLTRWTASSGRLTFTVGTTFGFLDLTSISSLARVLQTFGSFIEPHVFKIVRHSMADLRERDGFVLSALIVIT